jgi:CPA2 family monovalent cation:H+ antiporter-2
MHRLHDRGVYQVVQPEFEAGLEITRQALLHLHVPASEIQRFTDTVRRELYAPLYEARPDYPAIAQLQDAARLLDLTWVPLPTDSPVVGKSIRELAIRSQAGVSVISCMRNGALHLNPDAAYCFTAGDWVAVIGTAEQITTFQGMVKPDDRRLTDR